MLRTPAPRAWRRLLGTTVIVASCLVSSGFAWTSHALPFPVVGAPTHRFCRVCALPPDNTTRNTHLTHPVENRTMKKSRAASILTSVAAAGLLAGASAPSQAQATDSSKDSYTIVQDERMYGPAAIATYGADAANGVVLLDVKWPPITDTAYIINARSGSWRLITLHRNGELRLEKDSPGACVLNVTHFPPIIVDGVRVYYSKSDISQNSKIDMTSIHTSGYERGQKMVAEYGPDAVNGAFVMRSYNYDGIKK